MIRVTIYLDADEAEIRELASRGLVSLQVHADGEHRAFTTRQPIEVGPADAPGGYTEGTRGGAAYDQEMQ